MLGLYGYHAAIRYVLRGRKQSGDHAPRIRHLPLITYIRPLSKAQNPMMDAPQDAATISEIIEMALSEHISFGLIRTQHGLGADQVKALMRVQLKPGSYRAWHKRVRKLSDQREVYK
jgi:uncharacterized protein (TIGR03643 family)